MKLKKKKKKVVCFVWPYIHHWYKSNEHTKVTEGGDWLRRRPLSLVRKSADRRFSNGGMVLDGGRDDELVSLRPKWDLEFHGGVWISMDWNTRTHVFTITKRSSRTPKRCVLKDRQEPRTEQTRGRRESKVEVGRRSERDFFFGVILKGGKPNIWKKKKKLPSKRKQNLIGERKRWERRFWPWKWSYFVNWLQWVPLLFFLFFFFVWLWNWRREKVGSIITWSAMADEWSGCEVRWVIYPFIEKKKLNNSFCLTNDKGWA